MLSRHLDVISGFVVDRPPSREHCSARWRIPTLSRHGHSMIHPGNACSLPRVDEKSSSGAP